MLWLMIEYCSCIITYHPNHPCHNAHLFFCDDQDCQSQTHRHRDSQHQLHLLHLSFRLTWSSSMGVALWMANMLNEETLAGRKLEGTTASPFHRSPWQRSDNGVHLYIRRTEITCDVADFKHGYDKKENTFAIKVSTPWMVASNWRGRYVTKSTRLGKRESF